jgi:CRISPR/Cas system-associated endoribonuclease Cas2
MGNDKGVSYILIFDIKKGNNALRLRVNRALRKAKAHMVQQSVWEHHDLVALQRIANLISTHGKAFILKKIVVLTRKRS